MAQSVGVAANAVWEIPPSRTPYIITGPKFFGEQVVVRLYYIKEKLSSD